MMRHGFYAPSYWALLRLLLLWAFIASIAWGMW